MHAPYNMLWYAQAQPMVDVTLNMLLKTPSRNHSAWSTFLLLKNLRNYYGCYFKSSGKRSMQIRNSLPSSSLSQSKNEHKWYSEYICPSMSMENHLGGGLLNAVKRHQRCYSKTMPKYIYFRKFKISKLLCSHICS